MSGACLHGWTNPTTRHGNEERTTPGVPHWYERTTIRRALWAILFLAIVGQGFVGVLQRDNDYLWHIDRGTSFLAGGELDAVGRWYPLSRWMANAIPAALPYRVGRAMVYLTSVAALVGIVVLWDRLARRWLPGPRAIRLPAALCTVLVLHRFVLRDLDDCGIHLLLVFLLSLAIYGVVRGRTTWGGFALGAAIGYKLTPIYLLGLLVWKRQWAASAAAVVALVALNLVPAVWLGWDRTIAFHGDTLGYLTRASATDDYGYNQWEPPRLQNQGLPIALSRFLQTRPEGHALWMDHPGFVQFGSLEPLQAKRVIQAMLLVGAFGLAYRLRHRWTTGSGGLTQSVTPGEPASEWAFVCAGVALLSPLCWQQHLVLAVPAVYLIVRSVLLVGPRLWSPGQWVLYASAITLVTINQRELLGRDLSVLLYSYKLDTLGILCFAGLVLVLPGRVAALRPRERNGRAQPKTIPVQPQRLPTRAEPGADRRAA